MKKELAGRRCDSDDDVIAAVKHFLEVQDSSLYKEAALSKRRTMLCQFIWNWLRLPEAVDLSIVPHIYTHIPVRI